MINESLLQPDTPSALDICNAALSKIGEAPLDALIANESTASRLCVLHYHPARRETLCMARWTFAATQTTLDSVSAQAPNSRCPQTACACWMWNARNGKCRDAAFMLPAPRFP